MAMENGMMVCSQLLAASLWEPPVHRVQKTVSHVSQNSNSWLIWTEHFGMTSRLCLDIRSSSWLTRKDGGKADTPPLGIVMSSLHIGHRKEPVSLVCPAAILVRQWRQTVWEHCRSLGVCSCPSYIPGKNTTRFSQILIAGFLRHQERCEKLWWMVACQDFRCKFVWKNQYLA